MGERKLLVVDDDRNLLELLRMRLESEQYQVTAASSEAAAKEAARAEAFDLAIIDLQLLHQDGISLMEELRLLHPDLPVIILTAHGSIASAVEAMQRGAHMYLTKPFDPRELKLQIERALEKRRLASEVNRLKRLVAERYEFGNIIARSAVMQQVLETVSHIADTDSTVLIRGESGTGKELIARAVHCAGRRREGPFIAVNCAALPEGLLESELFGHEKGAFTGAVRSSRGLFLQAHGGTIFLDEIGDMPVSIQAKFLRVLQERQFQPVGGDAPVAVDVRVIVATNKDLKEAVRQGVFRDDLFYRIHVIPVDLPPLRARKEDIPMLAGHFLSKYAKSMQKQVRAFAPGAMQRLLLHEWPGNVRELENTVEYAVAMTGADVIQEDLILPSGAFQGDHRMLPLREARDLFEKNYLIHLLELTNGTVTSAAELAGKYRADFYGLLRKHGICPGDFKRRQGQHV